LFIQERNGQKYQQLSMILKEFTGAYVHDQLPNQSAFSYSTKGAGLWN